MKPEAQRIAIAEACGYTNLPARIAVFNERRADGHLKDCWNVCEYLQLPDYLNDLNAMHEAEKVLNPTQQHIYYEEAIRVVTGYGCRSVHHQNTRKIVSASAPQRAEAFLRTIGEWKEEESAVLT